LREKGIIVRQFQSPARIKEYLRITIGTEAQSRALIDALKQLI